MVLDADDGGVGAAGPLDGLAADGAVVLVPDPGARAQVGAADQGQQRRLDPRRIGHRAQRRRRGRVHGRPVIERRLLGQGVERDVRLDPALVAHDDPARIRQAADDGEVQLPLLEDGARHVLAVRAQHHQHAFLAFRQHHLVGGHAGLALRHLVQVEFDADAALAGHLDAAAGQPGGAHVLDGDDGVGGHQLQAGFDQQLFGEGVADLHGGALFLGIGPELGARHGRAVDPVPPGLAADVDDRIADASGGAEEDAVPRRDADRHGIHQRVAVVGGVEIDLAAHGRHADAVAVAADAAHHAVHDALGARVVRVAEAQRVQVGDGAAPMVNTSRMMPPTPVAAPW